MTQSRGKVANHLHVKTKSSGQLPAAWDQLLYGLTELPFRASSIHSTRDGVRLNFRASIIESQMGLTPFTCMLSRRGVHIDLQETCIRAPAKCLSAITAKET